MKEQIKTIIISLVLLAAVVGALIWFGNNGNKPEPAAHGPTGVGMIERQIFLNTGATEPLVLNFKANVTP